MRYARPVLPRRAGRTLAATGRSAWRASASVAGASHPLVALPHVLVLDGVPGARIVAHLHLECIQLSQQRSRRFLGGQPQLLGAGVLRLQPDLQ
jgi:hypothetical protein